MKKFFSLRKSLLVVLCCLFAVSAAAFGLSLRVEKSYAATDYSLAENWFNTFNADVTQTKTSDDRFEFSRENDGGVISFRQEAFNYLISQGYDAIRITYVEKTPATGTNLGIYRDGETWRDSVWTYGVAQSRTFDIKGGAFSIHCAKASVTEFYFTFKAINTAALYEDVEEWFDAKVPCTKVSDNSFDFTVAGGADKTILKFSAEALDYLAGKGYDKIRMTYYGKNGATINMGLRLSQGGWLGWTDNIKPRSDEFKIDDLKQDPAINAFYVVAEGIDGFNVTFKAINSATLYEDVEEWFDAKVPCTKVSDNSFDFAVAGDVNTTILKFSAEALDYLTGKGYDKIRMTYYGKNGAAINMGLRLSQGGWLGWTSNKAPVAAEVEISSLKTALEIIAYYVPQDGTDGFNVTFKAINSAARYEDVEEWFTAEVPYTKVSDNSFDFTVAGGTEKTILKFSAEALDYLAGKGYDEIRLTYYGKNGAAINMALKNSDWLGWTSNKAPVSKEIKIVDLKAKPNIVAFYVAAEGIDGFNVTFKAINSANKEVTFNVNGEFNKTVEVEWNADALAEAMPQVTEADTVVIGYALNDKLYANASAVFTAASGIEGNLTIDVIAIHLETQDGASLRVGGVYGMRFTSIVGLSDYVTTYGMILTVRSNVDENAGNERAVGLENFTKENLDAVNLRYRETNSEEEAFKSYEQDGNKVFNLVLTSILEEHLTWQYIARSYVTVTYEDGSTVTYYSEVDYENNARSPEDVAYAVLESNVSLEADAEAFIKENYLSKKA